MIDEERRFISELISIFNSQKILEIGVAGCGGSANILNTLRDSNASLLSIDTADFCSWHKGGVAVGFEAIQLFGNKGIQGNWRLETKKDPSEVLYNLNETFDFAVIDTAHLHPIESLNFLVALPYLSDDTIVVLHDTTLYAASEYRYAFATRILQSSISAEKIVPNIKGWGGYPNIVAMQICSDTRKYIQGVF